MRVSEDAGSDRQSLPHWLGIITGLESCSHGLVWQTWNEDLDDHKHNNLGPGSGPPG